MDSQFRQFLVADTPNPISLLHVAGPLSRSDSASSLDRTNRGFQALADYAIDAQALSTTGSSTMTRVPLPNLLWMLHFPPSSLAR